MLYEIASPKKAGTFPEKMSAVEFRFKKVIMKGFGNRTLTFDSDYYRTDILQSTCKFLLLIFRFNDNL